MSEPFVGEIRMFAGNFAPRGWALADGQLLAISGNDALFSLYGTIYGGDGRTTFALPDLRGRIPIHAGTGPGLSPRALGSKSGAEKASVSNAQLPSHTHAWAATATAATSSNPSGAGLANPANTDVLQDDTTGNLVAMAGNMITNTGGSQQHDNVQPFLCINFIVALVGIYPSRN